MTKREHALASQSGKPKSKPYVRRKAPMAERRQLSAAAGATADPMLKQPADVVRPTLLNSE
jgi:hypothetical protein